MRRFLIDANLPTNITTWTPDECVFVNDIDPGWTDTQIWKFAAEHALTIVSKDSDFSHRVMLLGPPPRVIHIRIGNTRLKEFGAFVDRTWESVGELSREYRLVNVFADRIEGIK